MKTHRKHAKTGAHCPIAKASALVGDQWTILIVRDLLKGPQRFCELQESMIAADTSRKVNSKTLTERLKSMERAGIIKRVKSPREAPPRVDYLITKEGKALSGVIADLEKFGAKYL